MQREIKFRAFHKERKEYDFSEEGSGGWWGDCVLDCLDDYEPIQQYTGLKDKNGKEIYEGDITNYGTVAYHTDLNWDSGGSLHPGFFFEGGDMSYVSGFYEDIEVLGNIYESHE